MKYIKSNADKTVTVEIPIDELRGLIDIVNEFRNGPYAITDDQWDSVMMQPRDIEEKIISGLRGIFDELDSLRQD